MNSNVSGKYVIFNADDYGNTPGISKGILEAHKKGVVTSTTVMIGSAGVVEAIHEAQQVAPDLALGLHFTLSGRANRPILPPQEVPTLINGDGTFYPLNEWYAHYTEFDPEQIVRELNAQTACFIDIVGHAPDHLDAHHHIAYRHPAALRTMFELANQHNIPIRNIGFPADQSPEAIMVQQVEMLPESIRESIVEEMKQILGMERPRWPNYFDSSFYDKTATLGDLLLTLTNLPDGVTEIMCHPGYVDEYMISDYTSKREDEIKILTHKSVQEVIKTQGIALVSFDILRSGVA